MPPRKQPEDAPVTRSIVSPGRPQFVVSKSQNNAIVGHHGVMQPGDLVPDDVPDDTLKDWFDRGYVEQVDRQPLPPAPGE